MVMMLAASSWPRIHSYGAMLALAWILGWWLARRRARRLGIATWHIDWLLPLLLIGAGLGSRLGGRLSHCCPMVQRTIASCSADCWRASEWRLPTAWWPAFRSAGWRTRLRSRCRPESSCCEWGVFSPAAAGAISVRRPNVWTLRWTIAIGVQQVQTFPALCSDDWPLAVRYPEGSPAFYQHLTAGLLPPSADRSLPVHPVQLYEAAAVLVLWGLLGLVDRRLPRWGESFLLFGLGYCAVRFVCEWFRADSRPWAWGLTPAQFICLVAAGVLAMTWGARFWLAKRGHSGLYRRLDSACQAR